MEIVFFYRGNQVKIRLLKWALIHHDWCPYKKEKFRLRQTERMPCVDEYGHPQAQERGLEQILPSRPSEETHPADILISDF